MSGYCTPAVCQWSASLLSARGGFERTPRGERGLGLPRRFRALPGAQSEPAGRRWEGLQANCQSFDPGLRPGRRGTSHFSLAGRRGWSRLCRFRKLSRAERHACHFGFEHGCNFLSSRRRRSFGCLLHCGRRPCRRGRRVGWPSSWSFSTRRARRSGSSSGTFDFPSRGHSEGRLGHARALGRVGCFGSPSCPAPGWRLDPILLHLPQKQRPLRRLLPHSSSMPRVVV